MIVDALILDYGGVVIHEDPADYDAITRPYGLADGELWALVHSIPEYLPSRIGTLSGEQFQHAVRAQLLLRLDAAAVDELIERVLAYYDANAALRPVVRELLDALRGRVKLALLSNATRGSTARFEQKGLQRWFDAIVCSGDVGVAKPDPAAFQLVAQGLGVPLERCAFVDDVNENAQAARALGMQALHYHHARHHELVGALARWGLAVPGCA